VGGRRLTHCGLYRRLPGEVSSSGSTFEVEVAEHSGAATCMTCRQAVGLAKTVAFKQSEVPSPSLPSDPGAEMWVGPDPGKRWLPYRAGRGMIMTVGMTEAETKDWLRVTMAWCPGFHLLLILHSPAAGEIQLSVLRRRWRTFVSPECPRYVQEDFDASTVEVGAPPRTRYERMLDN